jgi:hypothetical protein
VCRSGNAYLLVWEETRWDGGGLVTWHSTGVWLSWRYGKGIYTRLECWFVTIEVQFELSDIIKMYLSTLALSTLLTSALASPLAPRQCTGPSVNAATVSLIKEFEGFVASPAPDPIGLPTVGYGHLCQTSGCSEVPYSFPLSQTTASQLLASDLRVCIDREDFEFLG